MYPHMYVKVFPEIKIMLLYPCINFNYFKLEDFHLLSVLFYLMHLGTIKKKVFLTMKRLLKLHLFF